MIDKENQINDIMNVAIEKIKSIVDTSTVVGVPFESKDGMLIIPLTKVSVGFVTGGGEYGTNGKGIKEIDKYPFAGGSGAGVSMYPIGLLSIKNNECKLIRVDEKSPYDKVLEIIPDVVSNIFSVFDRGDKNGKKLI